ncbi:DUF4054 domain-containing protein [Pantoea brenneri]|uniref:hypothetical protein n=1 Tax=Pantoea brenneri TaxID=472694 RepID=UPI00244D6A80|nr:hypothetical protein [Pantoea brenneri]MDH1085304.1 DUF4054 domain-containing protein [Pantoea brenneri]
MSIQDDFLVRFPGDFDADDVTTYAYVFDIYGCYYRGVYEEDCNKEIILNIIAHLMQLEASPTASATRLVSSRSVAGVSTSYADYSDDKSYLAGFLGMTRYGQHALFLMSLRAQRAYFV